MITGHDEIDETMFMDTDPVRDDELRIRPKP